MIYYMTIGCKYAFEPHPHGLNADMWVEIEADSKDLARGYAFARFGTNWAFVYDEAEFEKHLWKGGCQMRIGENVHV